jgi:hypothetical protein
VLLLAIAPAARAGDAADLALQLSNPVAALVSVPLQLNFDRDLGVDDRGERWQLNVQPVVPVVLNAEWNLISRTILPLVTQSGVGAGSGRQSGLGDVLQTVFFSPRKPGPGGVIWGVGPALLAPTGSDDLLSARQWAAGPSAVVLRQQGPWTYGGLANHLESFAGSDSRPDVSATFLQPFVTYTTPSAWTYGLNTESTYDWEGKEWSAPVNVFANKVTKLGSQLVSIGGGLRWWADSPEPGAEGLGLRLSFTLLFPTAPPAVN